MAQAQQEPGELVRDSDDDAVETRVTASRLSAHLYRLASRLDDDRDVSELLDDVEDDLDDVRALVEALRDDSREEPA